MYKEDEQERLKKQEEKTKHSIYYQKRIKKIQENNYKINNNL